MNTLMQTLGAVQASDNKVCKVWYCQWYMYMLVCGICQI